MSDDDDASVAEPEGLRAEFLGALLRGLEGRTRRLTERLEGAAGAVGSEAEQTRLGWGWAVANELAGDGGAPDRREPRGAAWLAGCLYERALDGVASWPRVQPAHADWRAAYALVLVTRAGLAGGAARAGRRAHDGGCAWWLEPIEAPIPQALTAELQSLFGAGELCLERVGDRWALPLPEAWRRPAREDAR
ncbi:MAG: hypothetical protein AAFZ65_07250 [Planctomycetota bacterium]